MTREEAIKTLSNRCGNSEMWAAYWIDGYEALGMLKLDEPKTVHQVLCGLKVHVEEYDDANCISAIHPIGATIIIEALTNAGFKIVENRSA